MQHFCPCKTVQLWIHNQSSHTVHQQVLIICEILKKDTFSSLCSSFSFLPLLISNPFKVSPEVKWWYGTCLSPSQPYCSSHAVRAMCNTSCVLPLKHSLSKWKRKCIYEFWRRTRGKVCACVHNRLTFTWMNLSKRLSMQKQPDSKTRRTYNHTWQRAADLPTFLLLTRLKSIFYNTGI